MRGFRGSTVLRQREEFKEMCDFADDEPRITETKRKRFRSQEGKEMEIESRACRNYRNYRMGNEG